MRQFIVISIFSPLLLAMLTTASHAQTAQSAAPQTVPVAPAVAQAPAEQSDVYNLWGYLGQNPQGTKVDFKQEYESAKADANTDFIDTTTKATVDFKNNLYKGTRELRDWLLTPPPKLSPKPVPVSYCYSSYQDVLCYRQPMPGWESRLIGYQGTDAEAPPPSITQPLPTRRANAAMEPKNRVASAQPVFVEMPAEIKSDDARKNQDGSIPTAVDAAHEPLPDPALAPQL